MIVDMFNAFTWSHHHRVCSVNTVLSFRHHYVVYEVCVFDLDRPWEEFHVCFLVDPVIHIKWNVNGSQLLIVTGDGAFSVWAMEVRYNSIEHLHISYDGTMADVKMYSICFSFNWQLLPTHSHFFICLLLTYWRVIFTFQQVFFPFQERSSWCFWMWSFCSSELVFCPSFLKNGGRLYSLNVMGLWLGQSRACTLWKILCWTSPQLWSPAFGQP